jgi:hypothetical protein
MYVEVGQERLLPLTQGPAKPGNRPQREVPPGDWTGGERGDDPFGDPAALGLVRVLVGRAELLGALPGQVQSLVPLVGGQRPLDPAALLVGWGYLPLAGAVLRTGAQDCLDPVQRVALAAAVAGGRLLHPAAEPSWHLACWAGAGGKTSA